MAVVAFALVGAASGTAEATSFALVIGQDRGLLGQPDLRYAESDAAWVADTFREVGVADDVTLLTSARPAEVWAAFERLEQKVHPSDRVVVFLSSHGSARGAHLDDEVLPWPALSKALGRLRAQVVVTVVDTCASGSFLTKGLARAPALEIEPGPGPTRARIRISSSGARELATESVRLGASPFVVHLVTGLRGAADADEDGAVSVAELYAWTYARTVADTLEAPSGPQHPERAADVLGAGPLVLARTQGSSGVTREAGAPGTCYVLDAPQTRVLAALPADAAISLAPGRYTVTCRSGGRARSGSLVLGQTPVVLDALDLAPRARVVALAKGAGARRDDRLSLGVAMWLEQGLDPAPALTLLARAGDGRAAASALLAVSRERLFLSAGAGWVLPWLGRPPLRAELGLTLGAVAPGPRAGVLFGQYVELALVPEDIALRGRLRVDIDNGVDVHGERLFLVLGTVAVGWEIAP